MHIVAVLRIIEQKGLDARCWKLGKAVVRQSKMLKNLLEAAGSRDTASTDVDVQARNVEIEQTSQELKKVLIKIYCIKKCLLDLDPI